MDITYLGHSSFKLASKDVSVVTDPFDPGMVGIAFPRTSATVVTVSHEHGDHNKPELVNDVKKVITGPGEYEIEGVSIIGIPAYHDNVKGAERGRNTVYVYETDGLRLCHLGDLGHKLPEETVSAIGNIDVLMVPVGGHFTIDAKEAAEVARAIDPRVVIPMHFNLPGISQETFGELADEKPFLKELGLPVREEKKLTLKADALPDDSREIVVLSIS